MKYVSLAEAGGYGLSAIAYVHGLRQAGVRVVWQPLFPGPGGYTSAESPAEAARRLDAMELPPEAGDLRDAVCDGGPVDVCLLHTVPELWAAHRQAGARHIGYTVWETSAIPPHWPALMASVDRLLTPSRFSAQVLADAGAQVPIDVVPHIHRPLSPAADGTRFRALHDIPSRHTVFYTINAWTARKAVWNTIHAYCLAFSADDDTTLVVKTDAEGPAHYDDRSRHPVQHLVGDLVSNYPNAPHVCLITREMAQAGIDDLHAAADCYVSLSHAEGWGLGAFEAAGSGNPVVMTGWGGQLDYLAEADALLVDYRLVPVRDALGAGSYRPEQRWAQADLDAAVDRLRWVRGNAAAAAAMGERLSVKVQRNFAAGHIIPRLVELIDA